MNTQTKLVVSFALAVILSGAIWGGYQYPRATQVMVEQQGSTAGTTNSTAKIASVSLTLSTTTPTTSSSACKLYNGDATDRVISEVDWYLSSVGSFGLNATGVAELTVTVATSTGIYLASGNAVVSTVQATSSANVYVASTTPGLTSSPINRVWAAGTCLNAFTNATSSSAVGTMVIKYFAN